MPTARLWPRSPAVDITLDTSDQLGLDGYRTWTAVAWIHANGEAFRAVAAERPTKEGAVRVAKARVLREYRDWVERSFGAGGFAS